MAERKKDRTGFQVITSSKRAPEQWELSENSEAVQQIEAFKEYIRRKYRNPERTCRMKRIDGEWATLEWRGEEFRVPSFSLPQDAPEGMRVRLSVMPWPESYDEPEKRPSLQMIGCRPDSPEGRG